VINVTLGEAPPAPAPTPAPPPPPPRGEVREHSVAPWIVVGVGGAAVVAGAVIFLTAPDRPSNCDKDTQKCTRGTNESSADFAKDKDRAGQADSQPILGIIVAGAGAALVAGGLIWHFLEPVGPKSGNVKFSPWTTGKSSGVGLSGTF
jgi:hypothetical protein